MQIHLFRTGLAALLLASALHAQSPNWSAFHGNAQRSGASTRVGPANPNLLWSVDLDGAIISSPIVAPDGTIVLGSVYRALLQPSHAITAVNPDGSIRWRFTTGFVDTQVLSSPAIAPDGSIYVGAQDGAFYALDAQGDLLWKRVSSKPIQQHPVVAPDGTVYVGIDGRLTAFSPSGSILWQSAQTDIDRPGGPSLGTDGTIYVCGGVQGSTANLYAYFPDGSLRWSFAFGNPYFLPLAPPAVGPDGTIHVYATALFAVNPNGTVKWVRQLGFGDNHYGSPAVDGARNVYYSGSHSVWKLNEQGAIVWEHEIREGNFLGASYSSPLVDRNGTVFTGLGTGNRYGQPFEKRLLALNPNGSERWHFDLPGICSTSAPAIARNGTLYVGCFDGRLYAFR